MRYETTWTTRQDTATLHREAHRTPQEAEAAWDGLVSHPCVFAANLWQDDKILRSFVAIL